ncbi:MAG: hypothetical protein A2020_07155 [Lentisphaerae bacterium GWF2_45_14]|nr:MAG: hypothetical protein A2020_07155 [Lentisphaerae bacterium GWF2_45_14]
MLTRELIRFRTMNSYAKPQFVDVNDENLLEFASQLISIYDPEVAMLRGEIEENLLPLLKSCKDIKFAKGLNKIMLDRCKFSAPSDIDYTAMRKMVFQCSAELLRSGEFPDHMQFRDAIVSESDDILLFDQKGIYSDLPDNETLKSVKKIFPRELLERYNCSLVQSLLLHSAGLEIEIEEPEPAKMRKMLKYLKFFRLLAQISKGKSSKVNDGMPDSLAMSVDGPASIFENTQKYGLQLASFFPAVCDMAHWRLKAVIKINDKELKLSLDESSGLVSHYKNFSSYVPEEIVMFHKLFKEKSLDWEICGHSSFLNLGGQELVFPDFSFRKKNSPRTVYLELFHRWHSTHIMELLHTCESRQELPLIIGVDKFLAGKPEIAALLEESSFFKESGFTFRDFPGVDRVLGTLRKKFNKAAAEQPELL